MPYRGYFELNCQELANTNRVVAHLRNPEDCVACRRLRVPYDDSWPGLTFDPEPPWFNPSVPASSEFVGVWVMSVTGLDSIPVQRDVTQLVCSGGAAAVARDTPREITFEALVVGCTNAGAYFGLQWLACLLRSGTRGGGVEMNYYAAHPEESGVDGEALWRNVRGCVLTQNVAVTEYAGLGGRQENRQASVYRVSWTLTALNPYVYGPSISTVIDPWSSVVTKQIDWVHAPDCEDPSSCALPVLFAAGCEPQTIDVTPAPVPVCGGCLPLCNVETRTWSLGADPTVMCGESAVSTRVTNNAASPLTVNFHWRPTGSTDPCARTAPMQVNGLPQHYTAVADSVGGRPYVVDTHSQRIRQVGIVTTPDGRPWAGASLDRSISWELVAESAPGADYNTTVTFQDRES